MSARRGVRKRRRWWHDTPFALAEDGAVLLNVGEFDGIESAEDQLRVALSQSGRVFIGVEVSSREVAGVSERVHDALRESAALLAGVRLRRRK